MKEVLKDLAASLKLSLEREEAYINREIELKKEIAQLKACKKKLGEEAQQKIEMAEAQYRQELDKKTKAMAYGERKQRSLNKLKERIENEEEEVTIEESNL